MNYDSRTATTADNYTAMMAMTTACSVYSTMTCTVTKDDMTTRVTTNGAAIITDQKTARQPPNHEHGITKRAHAYPPRSFAY